MRKRSIVSASLFGAVCSAVAAHADPLANARAGMLQCYSPDTVRKTCNALAGYRFIGRRIDNPSEVLLSPKEPIIMKAVSPVEVRGAAICGPIRKKDIDAATILIAGEIAPAAQAAQVKAQVEAANGPRLGKEVCTVYEPQGNMLIARITINGVPRPDLSENVLWVRPTDGYRVAP